ncbi:hypothetical protein C8T65DRAFT_145642 [Cerioporus squamosus]|nr:hypothetical protein C8T65DRAFT_145642 [Cerioporus squamosus]
MAKRGGRKHYATPVSERNTIRRFMNNLAEMKQIAARDFDDAPQCFIAVYERLLPEPNNTIVLDLLLLTVFLHGLHKPRMHVDATLTITRIVFTCFTVALRKFKDVACATYHTEARARTHRQAVSAISASGATGEAPVQLLPLNARPAAGPRQKPEFMTVHVRRRLLG